MALNFVSDGIRALQELIAVRRTESVVYLRAELTVSNNARPYMLTNKDAGTLPLIAAIHIAMTIHWVLAVFFIPVIAIRIDATAEKIVLIVMTI